MQKMIVSLILILSQSKAMAYNQQEVELIKSRCLVQTQQEPKIYIQDFHWGMSLDEMLNVFSKLLKSGKRLAKRSYYDSETNTFRFPYMPERGGSIEVPLQFIKNVRNHVETSLQRNYAEAVMFPDMGHSHFLIPEKMYQEKYMQMPNDQMGHLYEGLFQESEMQILYHTAEQLTTMSSKTKEALPDRYLQWRYHTRNVVGDNNNGKNVYVIPAFDSNANTAGAVDGYYWWGAGFNISASESGCFPYHHKGQTFYFDLSLFDLESDPNYAGEVDP